MAVDETGQHAAVDFTYLGVGADPRLHVGTRSDGDDPAVGYGERLGGGPVGVDGQDVSDDDEVRSAGHEVDARPQGLTYGLEHVLVLGHE